MKTWTLEVKEFEGDHILEFNDEILAETGWKEGDVLEWIDNKDGSWTLRKKLDDNHGNTDESKT